MTMKFLPSVLALVATLSGAPTAAAECTSPGALECALTETPPTLDGELGEWASVAGIETEMYLIGGSTSYPDGAVSYKCLYDNDKIYFALQIPGKYRFDSEDDHLCAAIGTMFKVGSKATYVDMGGCPDALAGCDSVPDTCSDYLVDVGCHWELKTTEQKVEYGINEGTGNDLVANKDDEYAVSSYCRFDDDDAKAANEWTGAWSHTNPVDGETGDYIFEIARPLSTMSSATDAQLVVGESYEFGIAYWDPYENEDIGWTKPGHYLTGCAKEWIDLSLGASVTTDGGEEDPDGGSSPATLAFMSALAMAIAAAGPILVI